MNTDFNFSDTQFNDLINNKLMQLMQKSVVTGIPHCVIDFQNQIKQNIKEDEKFVKYNLLNSFDKMKYKNLKKVLNSALKSEHYVVFNLKVYFKIIR